MMEHIQIKKTKKTKKKTKKKHELNDSDDDDEVALAVLFALPLLLPLLLLPSSSSSFSSFLSLWGLLCIDTDRRRRLSERIFRKKFGEKFKNNRDDFFGGTSLQKFLSRLSLY